MENNIDINNVNELITEYERYLYKVIISFLKNHYDTEDALQDIKIKIINSYDGNVKNFKFWSSRIATNHCLDILKARRVRPIEVDITPHEFHIEYGNNPESIYMEKVTKENVLKIIDELKVKYGEVLKLYYFSELTYEEIGDKLNISKRTVATRIYRGKKLFKERWEKYAL